MEDVVQINKDVNVVAYYFKNAGHRLKGYPKKVEFSGKSLVFAEDGQQKAVQKDGRLVDIYDMSDGQADYRLEFDAQNTSWKLVSIFKLARG